MSILIIIGLVSGGVCIGFMVAGLMAAVKAADERDEPAAP
jgi:hypothetical protein